MFGKGFEVPFAVVPIVLAVLVRLLVEWGGDREVGTLEDYLIPRSRGYRLPPDGAVLPGIRLVPALGPVVIVIG